MKKLFIVIIFVILLSSACVQGNIANDNLDKQENSTKPLVDSNIKNENYKLFISENDIIRNTSDLDTVYKKYYSKYIKYIAPNGKSINIIAQDKVNDEQLLRAYNQLSYYLENFGEYDKSVIANRMADNKATLIMPNGADGETDIPEEALVGQPLYQMEVPTDGGKWYIDNDYHHRDAAFEEIFHMVQDYGIGTKGNPGSMPDLQKEIYTAMSNALPKNKSEWGEKGLWGLQSKKWLLELEKEGSLEQEYLASVIDSYYGLWGPYKEANGGMWGIYTSKTREDVIKNDILGYKIVSKFLPSYLTYMVRIDPEFSGSFKMYFDKNDPYTYKSQYMINTRLLGSKNSGIIGNAEDNTFMGNMGDNTIEGKEGIDVVQYSGSSDQYKIFISESSVVVEDSLKRDGKDKLFNIEILRFTDRDIYVKEIK